MYCIVRDKLRYGVFFFKINYQRSKLKTLLKNLFIPQQNSGMGEYGYGASDAYTTIRTHTYTCFQCNCPTLIFFQFFVPMSIINGASWEWIFWIWVQLPFLFMPQHKAYRNSDVDNTIVIDIAATEEIDFKYFLISHLANMSTRHLHAPLD